uniref:CBS domain-containing protein n=1 Tax=Octactis speculum TaxID=3111310 RepID=A0A7S2G648_9STRA
MMLVVYLPVSAYANGLSCSTGIVVPCLLNGALIGRIFGLLVTDICGISPDDPYTEWIDPGAFALIGSAAFFSGVARITMALTVIITEISDDSNFILPIMISIVIAKWTADSTGNHPIYHALQGLKGLPVLASNPHTHAPLASFSAIQVATDKVITMPLEISVRKLAEILRTTKHNAYPCTMSSENGEIFVGLIRREHLIGLIQKEDAWYRKDNKAKARWHNISKYVTGKKLRGDQLAAQELLAFDRPEMLQNETENGMLIFKSVSGTNEKYFIDLKPYVDMSSHTVSEGFSLKATYVLFTSMGLRHLVIVDVFNRVRGIITRHNLLEENLNMCLHRGTMVHPAGMFEQLIRKSDKKCELNESQSPRVNPAEKFHEMVEQKRRDDEEEIDSSIRRMYQDD